MKIVLQRVKSASTKINGEIVAEISAGLVLLVGVDRSDDSATAKSAAEKILSMRIFEDSAGKMNLSAKDIKAEILSVPNFTLSADISGGNRPGFSKAASPDSARKLFDEFNSALSGSGLKVLAGVFGARMEIGLVNDGPITFVIGEK